MSMPHRKAKKIRPRRNDREQGLSNEPPFCLRELLRDYAQRKPSFDIGKVRTLLPQAAKIAFATAGSSGGSGGSPRPVGGFLLLI